MKTMRVGVLGVGRGMVYARAYRAVPGAETVALCDRDRPRLFTQSGYFYADFLINQARALVLGAAPEDVGWAEGNAGVEHPFVQAAAAELVHGQGVLEAVKDPVLLHAAAPVLVAFGLVVALDVSPARGDEFRHDARQVALARQPAQTSPEDAVRPPAVLAGVHDLLVNREIERGPLGMMLLVLQEPAPQRLVRVPLTEGRRGGHDEHSVD